ncbi:sulfite exporter TauE/SafE family protein [Rhodococcus globerulus]|uniref:sulfite exporter TauE/SafE family protein n=1 Tax=Rhodococcus globerulus TaxID=33008 RepID=UPI001F2BB46B|nr:sulfite exporter TauE/SafE family protein [Rhodococcus globerulus]MCE4265297.1 sulfite exporter TauE/SafE family protein [Rhodococcus globerulus]
MALRARQSNSGGDPNSGTQLGIGFTGGAIGGLLGGGSGVFYVPALEKVTALTRPSLHGTAGAANIAVTGIGAVTFAIVGGSINLHAGTGMVIGGTLGAFFGARLILRIPHQLLRWLFVTVLLVTCLKLFVDAVGSDPLQGSAIVPASLIANMWFTGPVSLLLGFVIGAWSAGMGLGGGLLAVPALMLLFGADLPTAEGTSLLMFFPNAIVGTIVHAKQGTADMRLGTMLNIGAAPGAVAGVLVALALDVRILSVVFGTFALVVAVRELYRMWRETHAAVPSTQNCVPGQSNYIGSMSSDKPLTED